MAKNITREDIIAELQRQVNIREGQGELEFTMIELVRDVFTGLSDPAVRRIMKKLVASKQWATEERIIDGRRRMVYWRV